MDTRFRIVIDRFEGDFAILLAGEEPTQEWRVPGGVLPAGAREGDALALNFIPDPEATQRATALNAELRARLERPPGRP